MIDYGILITGGIGLVSTIVSGWTSWFFARKKYNAEVESSNIENMKASLSFYKSNQELNNQILGEHKEEINKLKKENKELKDLVDKYENQIDDMKTRLAKLELIIAKYENKDGVKSKKNSKKA